MRPCYVDPPARRPDRCESPSTQSGRCQRAGELEGVRLRELPLLPLSRQPKATRAVHPRCRPSARGGRAHPVSEVAVQVPTWTWAGQRLMGDRPSACIWSQTGDLGSLGCSYPYCGPDAEGWQRFLEGQWLRGVSSVACTTDVPPASAGVICYARSVDQCSPRCYGDVYVICVPRSVAGTDDV